MERLAGPVTHRRVLELVRGRARGGRLLEAACGSGALAQELAALGFRVVAADLQATRFASPEIPFLLCDLNCPLPFREESFDWITCVEGVEHLQAPSLFLSECARLLRPGGRLLLTTPNLLNLASRLRFLLTGFFSLSVRPPKEKALDRQAQRESAARDHVSLLPYPLLRWRLRRSGFLIEQVTTDRRRLAASALLPLFPLSWWFTRTAFAGEKDPSQRRANREIRRHLMSPELLLGRTLIVLARKQSPANSPGPGEGAAAAAKSAGPRMVHVDAGLDWGGGQSQSLGLALGLAARGHRVTFIAQPGSRLAMRAREGGLSLVEVRMRSQFDLVALLKLKRRFRDLQAEVVHLHDSRSHALGGLAARWAGVPVVLAHKRTDRVPAGGWWSRRKYERWVDRVICVSEASRRAALLGGVPADRLVLIHDSVDTDWFRPPADREQAKGALGYRPEDLLVVQVGRFCPAKGQRVLVEAAARVVQKLPAARFLLCGEGPEEKRLRARVQELALERAIRFEGFREDVRPVLAAADVAAMPSRQEGLGVAALEAMAMAAPVVASRAGGLPEAVAEGETGLLVAPGDAGELAQGLLRLLADPRLRERMGKRGRERVEREFAREAMVARTEQLYLELAEGKRRWQRSAR